ncbi:hypothetical protein HN992_03610 [Candidatus Woesearchaeota archaeon]|jgi:hypothetical protein|nr:hypothetical protein [Candidatus Woesearchaeota archaeon]MBT7899675.1 hypothetical protein [Candidatus Neomarinimicrobiota bacterium]
MAKKNCSVGVMMASNNNQYDIVSENEYYSIFQDIYDVIFKLELHNKKGRKGFHLNYIFNQMYYGFIDYIPDGNFYYSKCAHDAYKTLKMNHHFTENMPLSKLKWKDQPKIDEGRKILHQEHIFTGTMFRKELLNAELKNPLSKTKIKKLVNDKYRIAWITKSENKMLDKEGLKMNRSDNPFKDYRDKKIILVGGELPVKKFYDEL